MFDTLLIANRGEIACRVIRTAKRMGLRAVAVYSEADAGARHVAMADEAHLIGPAPAADSYLRIDRIIAAAVKAGADAIHPGYGFLAENAAFAEACAAAGIVFVGPPVEAIRAMGSKSAAKSLMEKAGVPLVPGYHRRDQGLETLKSAAQKIGYPVLIKASAGGGGKGMRVVAAAKDLKDAIAGAKRESKAAFGDDLLLIEKYLEKPRHIEIQVFADSHGNALHLFERDCSLQRRHQKVIEEAPAPGMTEARRAEMGVAAVAAAKAVGYVGAGTVEFIVDAGGAFYFMEMNTRLQVEHPVTEMITGQDLVEWQLRVAAGEKLPCRQDDLAINGHAVEARLYAEDATRDFVPATGRLAHLRFPAEDAATRVETGVRPGDVVSVHYDPMIAKLVVWGPDRRAALKRLQGALSGCTVAGLVTNRDFLAALAAHPKFMAGAVDTGFIARHRAELVPAPKPADDTVLGLAALAVLAGQEAATRARAEASADPWSPWHRTDGWRLNDEGRQELRFDDGTTVVPVMVHYQGADYRLDLPGGSVAAEGRLAADGTLEARLGDRRGRAVVARLDGEIVVFEGARSRALRFVDPRAASAGADAGGGRLTAPMPGKIIQVHVKRGAAVAAGQALLVMEAMKMEHTIAAPADGKIVAVHYAVGDQVEEGADLLDFEPTEKA